MADLPPGFEIESRGSFDPLSPLLSKGIEATNGYRTQGDIQRLKEEGYTPASNSDHLRGDAVDLVPGKSGWNLNRLAIEAKKMFGPEAQVGIHNGTHVHVSLKGWGQAPGTPGTPHSGLPPTPPGFELEQRGSLKGQNLSRPDYSEMTPGGDAVATEATAPDATTKTVADPDAGHLVDSLVRSGAPYGKALATVRNQFPEYPAFSPDEYKAAVQYHAAHPNYSGSFGSATRDIPLSDQEKANNDFMHSKSGAIVGHTINATAGGLPVLLAGDKGNYFEDVSSQEHPTLSAIGDMTGNVIGAVGVGKGLGLGAEALSASDGALGAGARFIAEHPGMTQTAADLGTGASYGAGEAGPGHRLEGAAYGAGTTLAMEGLGRAAIGPGLRFGRQALADAIENRAARQVVLPHTDPLGDVATNAASPDNSRQQDYIDVGGSGPVDPFHSGPRPPAKKYEQSSPAFDLRDTRGEGTYYHGARGEIPELTEGHYNPSNIYGGFETFYTTDAADIAKGYGRKRASAQIYRTEEKAPVKFFDMERELPTEDIEKLFAGDDLAEMAVAEVQQGGKARLREVMDEMRGLSSGEGLSKDEVQERFDTAVTNLRQQGFGGMTHIGGLKTNRQAHSVRIYFDAPNQLSLSRVEPRTRDVIDTASMETQQPAYATMASDMPEVSSRPVDRIEVGSRPVVAPGTEEQRAVASEVQPNDVTAPPLSEIAKAGNINLKNIETPEDIDALMRFTSDTFGEFKGERRGVQSWKATEALANDLGMLPDDLLARRTGEALNAEQIHAARGILSASAAETRSLADKAITGSAEDKAAFVKSFLLHAAITEKASGAAAEAGRALNIYRKVSQASLGDRQAMQDAIKRMQGGTNIEQVAEMVRQLGDDPTALNRLARDALKPRFRDKLMFVWINSLLSGPKTHVVNMSSNLLTAAMGIPEHAIAAGLGSLRRDHDKVLLSEIGPRFYGMVRGGAESLASAKEAFAVGEAGGKTDSVQPAIGGRAGKIISIPTRLLNAEDAFFKGMAKRSELAGLAVRKARSEGLKGEALANRIDQLLNHPSDEMMSAAADAALYKTFQRPLGPAGQKLSKAIQAWGWPKLFVPFIRTPTNLLKYAVEHSPAAPMLTEVRADFLAGGAKRDLAIARMVMGTGIGTTVAGLAANGHITGGGPADPSAKRALEANGWQPYSVKVGDTYVSYRRLDPWATVLGIAADSVELQSAMTEKQQQDTGAVLIGALVQNLSSKTWLSGFSDLIDAITDPQANAKNVLTRLGASMATPTLSAQVAQAIDPDFRDTNGAGYIETLRKKIEARVPIMSKRLIPRRDIMGDEVTNEMNPVARFLSPFDISTDLHDPNVKAILDSGARFSNPTRTLKGARLPDDMYDIYQSYSGQLTKQYITTARTAPDWGSMDRAAKAKAIEKAKNRARKDARSALFAH